MVYICNYNTPGAAVGPPERGQPGFMDRDPVLKEKRKRWLSHLTFRVQYDPTPLETISSVVFSGKRTQFSSFCFCSCDLKKKKYCNKSHLREREFVWLTVAGYSPLLQGSQNGRNSKEASYITPTVK